jgi:hypothetical protein
MNRRSGDVLRICTRLSRQQSIANEMNHKLPGSRVRWKNLYGIEDTRALICE